MDRRLLHGLLTGIAAVAEQDDAIHDGYGFFGVLYSASFWNGFQMVS